MSRVDDELRQAIGDHETLAKAENAAKSAGFESAPTEPRPTAPRRSLGLLFGLLAMGAAILTLVLTGYRQAAVYSKNVDELLRDHARFQGRNVRVVGTLVEGTLARRNSPCEYRFQMTRNQAVLTVFYPQCVVPDTFRDVPGVAVDVTAEGQLTADGSFRAHQIMAKCPSKYEMRDRSTNGEPGMRSAAVPRDLMR
jgi:cytochrome c-type biogenesis protein CcmE